MSFTLPVLKYDYKALEPYIDAQTMEIHYAKHHANGAPLIEDVAAEAPQCWDRVRDVQIQILLELGLLALRSHDAVSHGDGVFLDQLLELGEGGQASLDPGDGIVAHLQMQVRAP